MPKKKLLIITLAFILSAILLIYIMNKPVKNKNQQQFLLQLIDYTIENQTFQVYIADTDEERTKGLSQISSLDRDGMLFIFDKPYKATFWNKDTHLDLELWWIRDNSVIKKDYLPSVDKAGLIRVQAPIEVDKVLELVVR